MSAFFRCSAQLASLQAGFLLFDGLGAMLEAGRVGGVSCEPEGWRAPCQCNIGSDISRFRDASAGAAISAGDTYVDIPCQDIQNDVSFVESKLGITV